MCLRAACRRPKTRYPWRIAIHKSRKKLSMEEATYAHRHDFCGRYGFDVHGRRFRARFQHGHDVFDVA
jgi:hypothetical protein